MPKVASAAPVEKFVELGYAEITSNAAITATLADVAGLAITFTAGNRPVKLVAHVDQMSISVADKVGRLVISDDANNIKADAQNFVPVASGTCNLHAEVVIRDLTPGTSYTFKVRAAVGSASTGTINASTTSKPYIQAIEV